MGKPFQSTWISATAFLLILLFVYTASSKLLAIKKFELVIAQSPLLADTASVFSVAVPIIELLIAILLVIPKWRFAGLLASFFLLLAFSLYIAYMLLFASHLPCGCGGVISGMSWSQHLLFNLFFWAITGISIYFNSYAKLFIAINRGSRKPVETSRPISHS
ncbi:MAG TPA: MauE/DoxX family redox-associated membrane protein [Flavisolibacter sp.]|nr:MauE/DoxX family redox-associated membrane protein [Flavisolibacter sp.]